MSAALTYAQYIARAEDLRLVSYYSVLSSALWVYDLLLTIADEIELIWFARWNLLKVLYLFQRYMPLVDTVTLVLYATFSSTPSVKLCASLFKTSGWMFMVGIAISEIVLTIRALAAFGNTKWRSIFTAIFFLACWVPNFYFLRRFQMSVTFDKPNPGVRCFANPGAPLLHICWIFLMVYEAGILTLIAIPAFSTYRYRGNSALFDVVYRDGIIYYLFLFLLSAVNVTVIVVLRPDLANLLSCLERVVHSTLTSRVILRIRSQGKWHAFEISGLQIPVDIAVPLHSTNPILP